MKMTEVSLKWPCHGHKHWLQNDTNGYEMLLLVVFTFIKYSKGPTRIYEKITSYQYFRILKQPRNAWKVY